MLFFMIIFNEENVPTETEQIGDGEGELRGCRAEYGQLHKQILLSIYFSSSGLRLIMWVKN